MTREDLETLARRQDDQGLAELERLSLASGNNQAGITAKEDRRTRELQATPAIFDKKPLERSEGGDFVNWAEPRRMHGAPPPREAPTAPD